MELDSLVRCSDTVATTRSRSAKLVRLSELLRTLHGPELELGTRYLCGVTRQDKLGVGPALLRALLDTAAAPEPSLSLTEVDGLFGQIATAAGTGAAGERRRLLGALLVRATRPEQQFLARLITGELRQGALDGLMVEAIAHAADVPAAAVRRALAVNGDIGAVSAAALNEGAAGLGRFRLRLFQPLLPMLALSAETTDAALDLLGEPALEYKLDGVRIQVHKVGAEVRVFTRHLHEVTHTVPEIVEWVQGLPARAMILDGEALALGAAGRPHPFPVTMKRFGRLHAVDALRAELPLSAHFFDCLHLDDTDLLEHPARERWAALADAVPAAARVPRLVTGDRAQAEAFLRQAMDDGHEGLVAKVPEHTYLAGSRSAGWLKIKPAQTLDLVILAAEWGSGRRRGWLSNLHLAARDSASGRFIMLGKTFKGLTDAMLCWQTDRLLALEIGREDGVVHVRPELVVEIAFDAVQASSRYPGGATLRFARVRRYREDKRPEQADELSTVLSLLHARSDRPSGAAAGPARSSTLNE